MRVDVAFESPDGVVDGYACYGVHEGFDPASGLGEPPHRARPRRGHARRAPRPLALPLRGRPRRHDHGAGRARRPAAPLAAHDQPRHAREGRHRRRLDSDPRRARHARRPPVRHHGPAHHRRHRHLPSRRTGRGHVHPRGRARRCGRGRGRRARARRRGQRPLGGVARRRPVLHARGRRARRGAQRRGRRRPATSSPASRSPSHSPGSGTWRAPTLTSRWSRPGSWRTARRATRSSPP